MSAQVNIGYVPLMDAAPLIVAVEMGLAAEEGLHINLMRENSWSAVRDKLTYGLLDGAHMLYPMAIAMTMGIGATASRIDVPMVLSMNGNSFVASTGFAAKLRDQGADGQDAHLLGQALIKCAKTRPIRVAVPFLHSMHVTMLRYLVSNLGGDVDQTLDFMVCPPSLIEDMLAAGEIDAFMVGAPWGTNAVDNGVGEMMLASSAIWQAAPEKVLGLRHEWLADNPQMAESLVRVLYRAGKWVSDIKNASVVSELLSRPKYLNLNASLLERALTGEIVLNGKGKTMRDPLALILDSDRVGFPWQSGADWIAKQNAPHWGENSLAVAQVAQGICRTDVYRQSLESLMVPMPASNAKVEGSLIEAKSVVGQNDPVFGPDAFFSGEIHDPA